MVACLPAQLVGAEAVGPNPAAFELTCAEGSGQHLLHLAEVAGRNTAGPFNPILLLSADVLALHPPRKDGADLAAEKATSTTLRT